MILAYSSLATALVNDEQGFSVFISISSTLIRFPARCKTPNTKAFAHVLGVFILQIIFSPRMRADQHPVGLVFCRLYLSRGFSGLQLIFYLIVSGAIQLVPDKTRPSLGWFGVRAG